MKKVCAMTFNDLERCFKRALIFSFDKKKILFAYPFLFLCGIIFAFARSIAYSSSQWVVLSLIFLPILFSFAIIFILGVFLVKIYYSEVKNQKASYFEVMKSSFDIIIETLHISVPPIFAFVIAWVVFGLFVVIKEIPHIGWFIGVIISIIPFLIVVGSICLCIANLATLFFVTPALALKSQKKLKLVKEVFKNFRKSIFANISFFFIASIFLAFVGLFLVISAYLTKLCFAISIDGLYIGLQWFFIMIPFVLFLTPFVIFFFNFALETYNLLLTKEYR